MKDIDFDELDKAVNSLMTSVPKDPAASDNDTTTVPAAQPAGDDQKKSAPTAPIPPAQVPESSSTTSTPASGRAESLAARRSGRFMDVVHPSAIKKPERPARPVSRQGTTLTPPSPSPSESAAADTEAAPHLDATVATPSIPSPTVETNSVSETEQSNIHQPSIKSDWPDPLEMANFQEEKPAPEKPNDMPTPDIPNKPEGSSEKPEADTAPLTSPFLPDAKVEKRPLGGATADEMVPEPALGLGKEDLTVDDPDDQLPASPPETEAPLPEELQTDLVAIESGASKIAAPSADKPGEPATKAKEAPAATTAPAPAEKPEENPAPSGPVSIPQQYREEPSTGDKENGAIYDTDTYHQPLVHPAKKKSSWLWIVWIVLILIIGAGAGAALFLLGII